MLKGYWNIFVESSYLGGRSVRSTLELPVLIIARVVIAFTRHSAIHSQVSKINTAAKIGEVFNITLTDFQKYFKSASSTEMSKVIENPDLGVLHKT